MSASNAAIVRWAMHRQLGVYPRKKGAIERADWYLRSLSRLMGKALMIEDLKEARNCLQAMVGVERWKTYLEQNAGRPLSPALDAEFVDESAAKLAEAKKRREKALTEPETVVEPEKC